MGPDVPVEEIRWLDEKNFELTLAADAPGGYAVGDAVENASAQLDVVFRNNVACKNWANRIVCNSDHRSWKRPPVSVRFSEDVVTEGLAADR